MSDTAVVYAIIGKDRASGAFHKVGQAAKIAFAVGAAAVAKFGMDSVSAFAEAQKSQDKLQDAFSRFPALADTNIDRLNELNSTLAKKTKFDDDATAAGQATLAQFKLTGSQLEQITPLLQDYAAKTGKDLPTAANILGKALMGQGRGLKSLGIDFKDAGSVNANYAQIMDGLRSKVGGFAEKEGKSAAGQAQILKNQFGELEEKVGGMLVPALMKLVGPLRQVLDFVDRNSKTIMIAGAAIGSLVTVIWTMNAAINAVKAVQTAWTVVQKAVTLGQWLWNAAMYANPIGLVILAIVALVAVFVLLWTKSSAFRKFFIGMWDHIWGFMKGVGRWFAGPFANFFVNLYHRVVDGAKRLWSMYTAGWGKIITFLKGIPGKVSAIAKGMWNGLVSSFRSAINLLIGAWNALDFGINISIPSWVPGIGGRGFSVPDVIPDIPYLAKGGIVTSPTLAMLGEGGKKEAVIPLERGLGSVTTFRHEHTFNLVGGDAEMRRWFRRMIQQDGGTETTFATQGLG